MQGLSICSFTASANGRTCGVVASLRNDLRLHNKIGSNSLIDGPCFWRQCILRLFSARSNETKKTCSCRKAMCVFKRDGKNMNPSLEWSEAANEDIVLFFFQLDLQTRIQCALNMEQYEAANQLRNKLTEIETELIKQQEAKRGSSKSEAQDKAINILRLRADMQKAIENESYGAAAEVRDQISKLEADSLAASVKALAFENVRYAFRLGHKVRHKIFGYRAVICGMDPVCCESGSWMERANVNNLPQGPNQPFYQVLVDVQADPNLLVAYVAEENLLVSDQPDKERFDHPYVSFLFYGMDTAGDFIPVKQLREKYNKPRHEVTTDVQDEDVDKDT